MRLLKKGIQEGPSVYKEGEVKNHFTEASLYTLMSNKLKEEMACRHRRRERLKGIGAPFGPI